MCLAWPRIPSRSPLMTAPSASRDQILPHEDSDAAAVLEDALAERGVTLVKNARAGSVTRTSRTRGGQPPDDGVLIKMTDGRTVDGSHALMTVGSVPNTGGLGLERVGIELGAGNYLSVDRVSRTTAPGIYAAGDCTGLLPLASVAAMQGRIAMYHALGEGVSPIRLRTVAAAVFTRPEIAAVGVPQTAIDSGAVPARTLMLPLALAVQNNLTVTDLAQTLSVYPSLSGSIVEAARRLMAHDDLD